MPQRDAVDPVETRTRFKEKPLESDKEASVTRSAMSPPAATNFRPPRLVLRFALYAGAAVALTAALALFVVRANAISEAEHDVSDDGQYVADELGRDDLAGAAFIRPVASDLEAQLDELVGVIASARGLTRVTLLAPDGTITYSTDHGRIGQRVSASSLAKAREALTGRDWVGTSSSGPKMVESYVVVRWLLGGREHTAGVLIASRDYSAVAASIRQDLLFQAGAVLLALLVLYLALLPILRRVTATLEAHNQALRESEARYRALTEQASDGILVCDDQGLVLEANASLAALTGYSLGELSGLDIRELIEPSDLGRLPLRFAELLEGKTVLQERPIRRKDGSVFHGEFHGTRLQDGRIHASLRDVTERRLLEEELRRTHSGEAQARAIGAAAGEFRSLIESVERHAQLVAEGLEADHAVREAALELRDSAAWASSALRRVSSDSGNPDPHLELVEPRELIERMRDTVRLLLGKRVDLVVELEQTDRVELDPYHLEKVLLDLILHARDSMEHGGTVTVRTANVEFERKQGGENRLRPGRYVMLGVSDTGRLGGDDGFEVSGGGSGDDLLGPGLAAVYAIVHRTGGSVGIESEPELGTTVRVYFPSAEAADQQVAQAV